MQARLQLQILPQPDDATCGPTCLHAVYRYYGDRITLSQVVREVQHLRHGGTLGVMLACHALRRGYRARIYSYNLRFFDPTWLSAPGVDLADRLRRQARAKRRQKLQVATEAYLEFLERGGQLALEDLTPALLRRYLDHGVPVLTGLSATFLYRSARECGTHRLRHDDVRGEPTGHFVVLCGYDRVQRTVTLADPLQDNPVSRERKYEMPMERVLGAILLGIVTDDANLLIVEPGDAPRNKEADRVHSAGRR